jgi:hypothetical protein
MTTLPPQLGECPGTRGEPAAAAMADSLVNRDICCTTCGYNLRSLSAGGRCPECGQAIQQSLSRDNWSLASPPYVRKLLAGLAVLIFAFAAGLVRELLEMAFYSLWHLGVLSPSAADQVNSRIIDSEAFRFIFSVLGAVTVLTGTILVTRPDPDHPDFLARWRPWPVRLLAAALVVYIVEELLFFAFNANQEYGEDVSLLLGVLGILAMLVCLRHIAIRSHRPRMARRIGVCAVLVLTRVLVGYLMGVFCRYVRIKEGGWLDNSLSLLSYGLSAITIFVCISMVVNLYKLRCLIRHAFLCGHRKGTAWTS